ncbi:MAG: nucleoside monophosphate kinase, partial [Desulfurococcaceae archaeon]
MKVVLIGAPGAGKGVYAQYFSEKYCIPQISTGEIFRQEISRGTPLGIMVKPYVEQGLLVPDDIVTDVVKRKLSEPS